MHNSRRPNETITRWPELARWSLHEILSIESEPRLTNDTIRTKTSPIKAGQIWICESVTQNRLELPPIHKIGPVLNSTTVTKNLCLCSADQPWRQHTLIACVPLRAGLKFLQTFEKDSTSFDASAISNLQTSWYYHIVVQDRELISGCERIIEIFEQCHEDHPIAKFMGACNDLKRELTLCLRAEVLTLK